MDRRADTGLRRECFLVAARPNLRAKELIMGNSSGKGDCGFRLRRLYGATGQDLEARLKVISRMDQM
jgi:hypothetical protein